MIKKIMIFGRPGSGKSTFAMYLQKTLKIPLHHLDKYFFRDNWVERGYDEFLEKQKSLVRGDSWIIDGNSIKSLEMRYSKADLILYFNYPRLICYFMVLKRFFYKDKCIEDLSEGCENSIRFPLLKYMWNFEQRVEFQLEKLKQKYPEKLFMEIRDDVSLHKIKKEIQDEKIHNKSEI